MRVAADVEGHEQPDAAYAHMIDDVVPLVSESLAGYPQAGASA